jgi:hypothetical protein
MKQKTNTQLVNSLMTYSRQGVLMQAFIIEAIAKYAESVLKTPLPDNGFINPHAWTACANEALDTINNRNKETTTA